MNAADLPDDVSGALLRERILDYLHRNPEAADSVKGIANWWLADEPTDREMVEEAVRALVEEGAIERRRMPDGAYIYCLRRLG